MIPLYDSRVPQYGSKTTTRAIIIASSASYAFLSVLPQHVRYQLAANWGIVPAWWSGPVAGSITDLGSVATAITATLIHQSLFHLATNMLYVWVFADNVEGRIGSTGLGVLYGMSAIGSALAYTLSGPASPVPAIGASGAVAGILGAYVVMFPRAHIVTIIPTPVIWGLATLPAILFVMVWAFVQVVYATLAGVTGVSWWAHVGGFMTGAAIAVTWYRE